MREVYPRPPLHSRHIAHLLLFYSTGICAKNSDTVLATESEIKKKHLIQNAEVKWNLSEMNAFAE